MSVDVLVVGSGNGGLTAALCAYELGLRNVLVVDKSDRYGGVSATSGGGIWIPCSRYAREAGATDSYEEALEYVLGATPPGAVPREMQETYLREGPRMLDFLHERTRVRYESLAHYPDYWSTLPGAKPGHRSLEPSPILRSQLGADGDLLRDTHHMMWMFDRIAMTQVEAQVLMAQLPGWKKLAFGMLRDYVTDVGWRLRHRRSRRLACGCAGVARLRWSMQDRQMPLWLNTRMLDLLSDEGEKAIAKLIAQYPRQIEAAAAAHEPHRVAFYLHDLASAFHSHWNRGKDHPELRFVNEENRELTRARVALVVALTRVLASGLGILGVSAPEEMR